MRDVYLLVAAGAVVLFACDQSKPDAKGSSAPAVTSKPTSAKPAATSSATVKAVAVVSATAAPSAAKIERSKVPSPAEWNAAPMVEVTGAKALGCETKALREWLRVSCRTYNFTGARPKDVSLLAPRPDTYVFSKNRVASLVTRMVPGVDVKATFRWGTESTRIFEYALSVSWPKDAAKGQAQFVGVPKDARVVSKTTVGELASCMADPMRFRITQENEAPYPNEVIAPECVRGFWSSEDCGRLGECTRGEGTASADCQGDEANYMHGMGPTARCGIKCDPSKGEKACPSYASCRKDMSTEPVCIPK